MIAGRYGGIESAPASPAVVARQIDGNDSTRTFADLHVVNVSETAALELRVGMLGVMARVRLPAGAEWPGGDTLSGEIQAFEIAAETGPVIFSWQGIERVA